MWPIHDLLDDTVLPNSPLPAAAEDPPENTVIARERSHNTAAVEPPAGLVVALAEGRNAQMDGSPAGAASEQDAWADVQLGSWPSCGADIHPNGGTSMPSSSPKPKPRPYPVGTDTQAVEQVAELVDVS